MKQRVNVITLGVANLKRARRFYEALGWTTGADADDDVVFFQAGEMVVALWDRMRLAEDTVGGCPQSPLDRQRGRRRATGIGRVSVPPTMPA